MKHHKVFLLLTFLCIMFNSALFANDLKTVRLQLKWKHQFQFAGYYAAVEKGYYKDAGFNVIIRELGDNETPFDAVFSGKAEFGTSTTDILLARSNGKKAVVLASIFQHSPHVWVTLKKSDIQYAQDFVGKKIAVEPGAAELYAYLIAEGVSLNRCFIEEYDFNIDNLTNGKLDAISAYSTDEPYFFAQQKQEINILYPSAAGIDFYGDLLYTSENLIKQDPQMVEKFRAASLKGWAYAMANEDEIIKLIYNKYSKRHTLGHLRFEAEQMQKLVLPNVVEIGYSNSGRWEAILSQYKKLGRIDNSTSIKGLIYTDYLKQKATIPWNIIIVFSIALCIAFFFLYFYYSSSRNLKKEILKREIIQTELEESEALYRSILKASPDDITVTDLFGEIQIVSPATLQMLGCESEQDVMGKNVSYFTHPDEIDRAKRRTFLMLDGIQIEPEEYRLVRLDGSVIETELNAEIIKNAEGKPTGIVMIVRDITDRKQRETEIKQKNEELKKINLEKDKFFSIIAHDLRSPFHAFLGLTQLLLEQIDELKQDQIQTFAGNLNKSAANLYRLLENLLEWSRIERGLTNPQPRVFYINEAINESLKMFKDAAHVKQLIFEENHPADYQVYADYKMTETVIRNLLSNAVKFTHKGGEITISTKQTANNFVEVAIRDTGIGMSREIIESIFRLDANNNRQGTEGEASTGLGLLLCKEFVEFNNGALQVSSEEGKGSCFSFTLKEAEEIL